MQVDSKREMRHFNFKTTPSKRVPNRISKNDGSPLVSIITICNKDSNISYLEEMFNSLLYQTFPYWEWIIVTNTSKSLLNAKFLKSSRIKNMIQYKMQSLLV